MFILSHAQSMGSAKEKFEATIQMNHDRGLLRWINTKHIEKYVGDVDGIVYAFQKPEAKEK